MERTEGLRLSFAIVLAVNGAFTALALSYPGQETPMFSADADIPPDMSSSLDWHRVEGRLSAAGFAVANSTTGDSTELTVVMQGAPDYFAIISLRGAEGGSYVFATLKCHVAYFRSDCPASAEPEVRFFLAEVVQGSGLPLDVSQASYSVNDSSGPEEPLILLFLQLLLVFVSAMALIGADAAFERNPILTAANPPQ